ncbi:hypothetical protein V5F77_04350 [Xanthobacter sp. DSM 24535]|uniref:hypothetical protein n=1 Tax=Roseixanthobacter psychrophilus TaxID=3119917 RepID=UPI00372BF962
MMKFDLRVGERLVIGNTTIRLERKTGQLACLVVDAARDLVVRRERASSEDKGEVKIDRKMI